MLTPDLLYRCALATGYNQGNCSNISSCSISLPTVDTHTSSVFHNQNADPQSLQHPTRRSVPQQKAPRPPPHARSSVSPYSAAPYYSALALLLLQPRASTSSVRPVEGVTGSVDERSRCTWIPLKLRRRYYTLHLGDTTIMTAHLCITTYKSPHNEVLKLELCFVGQDCQRIPSILGATYGLQTKRLDLSYNAIRSLDGLDKFPSLEELILDNNFIDDSVIVPRLPTLHTLSLNKNKVTDLERLLDQICERLPNLRYLSLLGNEACPDQLSSADKDERDYRCYRLYVLHRMPRLKFLDSSAVRRREVSEAKKRGALAKTIRVTPPSPPLTQTDEECVGSNGTNTAPPLSHSQRSALNGTNGKTVLPETTAPGTHKGTYGIRRYRYLGRQSEGNRFIKNEAL